MTVSRRWWLVAGLLCAATVFRTPWAGGAAPAPPRTIDWSSAPGAASAAECGDSREGVAIVLQVGAGEVLEASPADALGILLSNCREETGFASVTATSFTQHGRRTVERILELELPGSSSVVAPLPLDAIGLTTEPLDVSGSLRLDLSVEFGERSFARALDPALLHFHPVGSSWLLYDSTSLREWFAGGALTPFAEALEREGRAPAAPTGPREPIVIGATSALAAVPGAAQAATIKLCVDYEADFVDSGVGEDHWRERVAARPARGIAATVFHDLQSSKPVFDGYLDDGLSGSGAGCTPDLNVPASSRYVIRITSQGRIRGNPLTVLDYAASPPAPVAWVAWTEEVKPGTWRIDLGPPPAGVRNAFNVYQAASFALHRHSGVAMREWTAYASRSGAARECGGVSCYVRGASYVSAEGSRYKFIIAHELGHQVGGAANPSLNENLCGAIQTHGICPESGCSSGTCTSHSLLGYELSKCALGEGFANFYSADVWNDHRQGDCWFRYWKAEPLDTSSRTPAVNCDDDDGNPGFDRGYMDAVCRNQQPATCSSDGPGCKDGNAVSFGIGTELDWTRQLWNVRARSRTPATFDQIMAWLAATPRWGAQDAYSRLDAQANAETTPPALRDAWNEYKALNSIDG